ncbi:unnamed protein product [Miscanthus lutarioriparius]|uniref:Uncharacterized protein n=1 Tax=Miscanthus lutarioriparius TaxID=422564 RepID=A0A811PMM4_9POAL|nr:unnamed protein product [Miscanthus lutarioriparius]
MEGMAPLYPNASIHVQNPNLRPQHRRALPRSTQCKTSSGSSPASVAAGGGTDGGIDAVRTMVAVCLLELVPFGVIDDATLTRRLQSKRRPARPRPKRCSGRPRRGAWGLCARYGCSCAPSHREDSDGLQIEEAFIGGKHMTMVWAIGRSKLLKELPESSSVLQIQPPPTPQ